MRGLQPLHRYFDFKGRSSRAEYWQWIAMTTVLSWIAAFADGAQSTPYDPSHKFTITLYGGTAIPWLAVGTIRLHDVGKSGWYYGGVWIFAAISGLVIYVGDADRQSSGDDTILGLGVLLFGVFQLYAAYVVFLTIKKGDPQANAYGEPPAVDQSGHPSSAPNASMAPRAVAAASSPTNQDADPLERIERLAKMRDAGALTDEEFQQQKAVLLRRLN